MLGTAHPYKRGGGLHQSLLGKGGHASSAKQKNRSQDHQRGTHHDYSLVAPIRQTASIFKQPVTVYKEHNSKVKTELKTVSREKPLQLFWTKRLSSLNTVNVEDEEMNNRRVILPDRLKSVGPGITEHMLLASISTHLHISKEPAKGQDTSMTLIEKNPSAYINPGQPLMSAMTVTEEDIQTQEGRVKESRHKLAFAVRKVE